MTAAKVEREYTRARILRSYWTGDAEYESVPRESARRPKILKEIGSGQVSYMDILSRPCLRFHLQVSSYRIELCTRI